jgi:hypothetical protein
MLGITLGRVVRTEKYLKYNNQQEHSKEEQQPARESESPSPPPPSNNNQEYVNSLSPTNGEESMLPPNQEQQESMEQPFNQSNDSSVGGNMEGSLKDAQVPVDESDDSTGTDNQNVNRISLIHSPHARVTTNEDYEDEEDIETNSGVDVSAV